MAYTPSARKIKQPVNNFAGMPNDANRVAMPFGNMMLSQDATATPVTSPVTNMSASGATLVTPANAVQLTINSSVSILVGEDGSYAQGIQIPANTLFTFDCAEQANIYLKPSSGTNSVYFQFKVV